MMKNNGGPAFPYTVTENFIAGTNVYPGMSLRDWFAGMILPTLNQISIFDNPHNLDTPQKIAQASYKIADAMLVEKRK